MRREIVYAKEEVRTKDRGIDYEGRGKMGCRRVPQCKWSVGMDDLTVIKESKALEGTEEWY